MFFFFKHEKYFSVFTVAYASHIAAVDYRPGLVIYPSVKADHFLFLQKQQSFPYLSNSILNS